MRRLAPALLLLVASACSGEKGGTEVWEPPPPGEYGDPCPLDARIGRFEVAHFELYSAVTGAVREEVIPVTVLQPVGEEGDCVLMQQENPYCEPRCAGGQTCDTDDSCIPFPLRRSVGTVRVGGLAEHITIEPDAVNSYSETDVPNPLFEQGDVIQLWADGDELVGFALDGAGVAPLEVANLDWTMTSGEALEITWVPSEGPGRILVTLNVDAHGRSPATMFCDVEDTGSVAIPASFVTRLFTFGFSVPATGIIERRTVDSAQIEQGCVELEVLSQRQARVSATPPD